MHIRIGVVAVLVMLPGLLLSLFDFPIFGATAGLGALSALMATLVGGWRLGGFVSIGLALATGVALVVADNSIGASLLMFIVAAGAGLTARRGFSFGAIPAAITVAFVLAQPPMGTHAAVGEIFDGAVTMLSAGFLAVLVGLLVFRNGPVVSSERCSWPQTVTYSLVLGVLTGIAAAYVVSHQTQESGAWLLMAILAGVPPFLHAGFLATLERCVGTVVGVVMALVIGLISFPASVDYLIATVFVVFTAILQVQRKADWEVLAFLIPSIVLIVSTRGALSTSAQDRLFATLVGAGTVLVVIGLGALLLTPTRRSQRREPSSVDAAA